MFLSVSNPAGGVRTLIRYDGREKIAWDILICAAVFLCAIVVPYRLLSGLDPIDAFYVFVTVVFCIDITVVFRTTVVSGRSVIADPEIIAQRYLRSWFFRDLLSALPFPVFVLLAGNDTAVQAALLPWLGGLRLVRLLSLLKVNSFFWKAAGICENQRRGIAACGFCVLADPCNPFHCVGMAGNWGRETGG